MSRGFIRQTKCAFHPNENIFNFCKSPSCFLPMCPICVKIHSEEHKAQKTHGDYECLTGVVGEIEYNVRALEKILQGASQEFTSHYESKKKVEVEIKRKLTEARNKLCQQLDRHFQEVEASLLRSLTNFYEKTVEEYTIIDEMVIGLQDKLQRTLTGLYSDRTLKTVITYYVDEELKQWKEQVNQIENKIGEVQARTATLHTDPTVLTDLMKGLDRYVGLTFSTGYETGGTATSNIGFFKDASKTKSMASSRGHILT